MKCSACGHANRATAKFCEECAVPLRQVCGSCGFELRPNAKFCDECGTALGSSDSLRRLDRATAQTIEIVAREPRTYTPKHLADKILQSKSALEGERKQVTVLFADIRGSMQLATQLDPERWHELLERYFAILTDAVHRFEGTVQPGILFIPKN